MSRENQDTGGCHSADGRLYDQKYPCNEASQRISGVCVSLCIYVSVSLGLPQSWASPVPPVLALFCLQCEISRERVPLRNAYKCVGQKASVRINNGVEYQLAGEVMLIMIDIEQAGMRQCNGKCRVHVGLSPLVSSHQCVGEWAGG